MPLINTNRTWIVTTVVLLLVLSAGWFLYQAHFQRELDNASQDAKNELGLISLLVTERLQKRNYQLAESFIMNWGKNSPKTAAITLTTNNGFVLAHYRSQQTTKHELIEVATIFYSYNSQATLKLRISIDDVYAEEEIILYQLLTGYFFVAIVLCFLVQTNLRTHKKKLELEDSQAFVHLLLDSTAESIYGIDTNGKCIFVNQACIDMLGYENTSELLGRDMHDLIHHSYPNGTHCPVDKCHIYQAFKDEHGTHFDDEVLWRKDGSSFVSEYWSYPIFKNEEHVGAVITFLNITDRIETHKALQKSEQDLAITLNSIGDAVITTDSEGHVTRINPVAEQLTGWSLQEGQGQPVKTIFPIINALTREPIENPVEKVLATGKTVYLSNHTTLIAKDGMEYQIADSAAPIRNDDDHILGMVLVFNDVTEQYQLREKAKKARQQMQGLFDDMQTMVGVLELDGTLNFVNNTPLKMSGLESDEVLGKKLWDSAWFNYDSKLQVIVKNDINSAATGEAILRDMQVFTLNGLLWIEFSIHPVFDEQGVVTQLVAEGRDVSQRKTAEEKVLHQAHFDTLTGLPNRFLTLDRLAQLLNEAQRNNELVAVLFLDLDDFKKINDTLGHETGDKLLIEAAERLNSAVRSGDTVGRLGGDEFIVLLGGLADASDARPIAENLLNRFRDAFRINGRELILTTSLGIAVYPEDGDNASELLRNADSAMYHSKDLGRNTYSYFTHAMNLGVSRRLALEEQLHGALDRNEFTVFYQPQVEISSGKIIGAEALLRWHNPALGDVSPDEFIPVAEQNGLIVPIGQFVLIEALAVSTQWHQQYDANLRMAVNLSPRQFRDPELVNFIEKAIKQSGISSDHLELEITEGVLMSAHSYIDDVLSELNSLGVSIAMDDFGTGYSSLSYLRRYPFDVLKIDRSFISEITRDQANRELISATIAMAHNLNLAVVAEGVETEEQLTYLKGLSCDYAQGFLFGKPMPAEKMAELLQTR